MCGARPVYLSCAFILEEGFAMDDFRRVVGSMQSAAHLLICEGAVSNQSSCKF